MDSKSAAAATEEDRQHRKPDDTDFQQQRLRAWQPLLTPVWVISAFFIIGIIFVPIGNSILQASNDVIEVETQYDQLTPANCDGNPDRTGCTVTVTMNIPQDMNPPIYVYYKLTNYYQNHRRYVQSRSDTQLYGETGSSLDLSTCSSPVDKNVNGSEYYPCGLIAESIYNDTISASLTQKDQNVIYLGNASSLTSTPNWMKDGIAWTTDKDDKFHALSPWQIQQEVWTTTGQWGQQLPSVADEDFMVWMRTAGLPTFRKLYRKITQQPLKVGDKLTFNISSVYPVQSFSGTKSIVISTTSWLGGKNSFLGYAYIIVGSICLGVGFLFLVKQGITKVLNRQTRTV